MRRAYLHGFASGPLSKKGQRLKEAFEARGLPMALPDLNVPTFRKLSLAAMLERLDALDADRSEAADGDAHTDADGWGLVGSSLGGWLAARWAQLRPDRVERLLLLCPAFDLADRWPQMLPAGAMAMWERNGSLLLPDGSGKPQPVHFGFYEESRQQPAFPDVRCETLVIHGTRDDRVPIESSRAWVSGRPNARLIEVDDGHDLLASQPRIVELALGFLG